MTKKGSLPKNVVFVCILNGEEVWLLKSIKFCQQCLSSRKLCHKYRGEGDNEALKFYNSVFLSVGLTTLGIFIKLRLVGLLS